MQYYLAVSHCFVFLNVQCSEHNIKVNDMIMNFFVYSSCELQDTHNKFILRTSSFKASLNLRCSPSSSMKSSFFNPRKPDQSVSSKPSPKQLPASQDLKSH